MLALVAQKMKSCEEAADADQEDPALFFQRVALLVELVSQCNR